MALHFDGDADMVLSCDNYFQRIGLMSLAVGNNINLSIVDDVQQQNIHILFNVHKMNFSFVPTHCDRM